MGATQDQAYDASEPFEVDFALGATMMVRREVLLGARSL